MTPRQSRPHSLFQYLGWGKVSRVNSSSSGHPQSRRVHMCTMSTSAQQRHPSLGPPAAPVTLQTPGQEERSQLCPCPRRTLPDSRLSAKRADPGCRLGGLRLDGKMGAAGDQVAHFFPDCQLSGLRRRDQPRVYPPLPQQLVKKPPTSRPRRVDEGRFCCPLCKVARMQRKRRHVSAHAF